MFLATLPLGPDLGIAILCFLFSKAHLELDPLGSQSSLLASDVVYYQYLGYRISHHSFLVPWVTNLACSLSKSLECLNSYLCCLYFAVLFLSTGGEMRTELTQQLNLDSGV